MKTKHLVTILIIFMIILGGCTKKSIQSNLSESMDGNQDYMNVSENAPEKIDYMNENVTMLDHMSGLGVYKADGSAYKTAERAEFSEDGFRAVIKYKQNMPTPTDQVLLVFADFIQMEFEVDGEYVKQYRFSVDSIDEKRFQIRVPIERENVSEFAFVVLYAPDQTRDNGGKVEKDYDWIREQTISVVRIHTGTPYKGNLIKIEGKNDASLAARQMDCVWITRTLEGMEIVEQASKEDALKLIMGNPSTEPSKEYVILSILDYQQVDFDCYGLCPVIELESGEKKYVDFSLPECIGVKDYQILMLGDPFIEENKYPLRNSSERIRVEGD